MTNGSDNRHTPDSENEKRSPENEGSSALQDMFKAVGLSMPGRKSKSSSAKQTEPPEPGDSGPDQGSDAGQAEQAQDNREDYDPDDYAELERGMQPRRFTMKKFGLFMVFLGIGLAAWEYVPILLEPRPPAPDVAATYNNKTITTGQLRQYISQENIRDNDNYFCEKHGFDHSKCDKLEACEVHDLHSVETYEQILRMMAVQRLVVEWADANAVTKRESVSHSLKDLVETTNVNALISELHSKKVTPESIPKWEVQQYFDDNKEAFEGKSFTEAEAEIRGILLQNKGTEFFTSYFEELKNAAGLEVNLDTLKVTQPTNQQIQTYYLENPELFAQAAVASGMEMRIVSVGPGIDSAALAQEAINKLQAGMSFEDVVAQHAQGGVAIPVTYAKGERGASYEEPTWKLEPGEVSAAFEDEGATVIFKMVSKTRDGQRPFAEVAEYIRQGLLRANMDDEYAVRKDDALFMVHGRRYTLGEFYVEFKELPAEFQAFYFAPEQKRRLVEQMVLKELLLEEYKDKAETEDDKHRVEHLKEQYLSQVFHSEKVDAQLEDVSDEEARKFYADKRNLLVEPASVRISVIWIGRGEGDGDAAKNRARAEEAFAALRNGADFAAIAKQYSQDATAQLGGMVPAWIHEESLPPEIASVVFAAKAGEITPIMEAYGRFYIFKIDDRVEPRQPSYEELESTIKTHLKTAKHEEMEANMEDELLKKAQFTVYKRTLRNIIKANEGAEIQ